MTSGSFERSTPWGVLVSFGKGTTSFRPLCSMVIYPSSMSILGVPYSPMVPSLMRWQFGRNSRMAKSTFSVPTTLLTWVNTACLRSIIE